MKTRARRLFYIDLSDYAEKWPAIVWIIDLNPLRIVYLNAVYEKLSQRSRGYLYRDPFRWLENIYPDDRKRVEKTFYEWINQPGKGPFESEHRVVRRDGAVRWLFLRGVYFNESLTNPRIGGTAEDITESKSRDLEKDQLVSALQKAVQFRSEFIATVAHDLKNPLTAVGLKIDLAKRLMEHRSYRGSADMAKLYDLLLRTQDNMNQLTLSAFADEVPSSQVFTFECETQVRSSFTTDPWATNYDGWASIGKSNIARCGMEQLKAQCLEQGFKSIEKNQVVIESVEILSQDQALVPDGWGGQNYVKNIVRGLKGKVLATCFKDPVGIFSFSRRNL